MAGTPPFIDEPTDTREAIMVATYRALSTHGYADLTIQRIGDEFGKSKSLLYHHYDGKDDLLLDFLDFMLERFEAALPIDDHEDSMAHLKAVLDHGILGSDPAVNGDFMGAMIELRAQAANDPDYRDHFTRSDRFFQERLVDVLRSGIREGVFRKVDPNRSAAFLHTMIVGAMTQRTTVDGFDGDPLRAELQQYLRVVLSADRSLE